MHISVYRRTILTLVLMFPLLALAQGDSYPLQSDWMQLVKGHRDPETGVEVKEVEDGAAEGSRTVTLAIPKTYMNDPNEIEEVLVIGRRPEKPEPLDITYEWLDDYDNDNYGLVIRLGKNSNWPIRLFVDSSAGFINN